jgi:hypothetical protein
VLSKSAKDWIGTAYHDYSVGKQTLSELSQKYGYCIKTLRRHFDTYALQPLFISVPVTPVALTFDGTFFGRGYGLMVYRAGGKNIHLQEMESETLDVIRQGLQHLITQGWQFFSITVDGRKGTISLIKQMLPAVKIQLCTFHQKAIIRRHLTTKPKTDCGKEIRILVSFMLHIDEPLFLDCLADIKKRYDDFLKERNEQNQFMHRNLRSALRSLTVNAPMLFTYQRYPELHIPNTTNSCDGSFTHWKSKVKIHRGLKKTRRAKMIQFLLQKS